MQRYKVKFGFVEIDEDTGGMLFMYKGKLFYVNYNGLLMNAKAQPWHGFKIDLDYLVYQVATQLRYNKKDSSFLYKCFDSPDGLLKISDETNREITNNKSFIKIKESNIDDLFNGLTTEQKDKIVTGVFNFVKLFKECLKIT
jgi:hypothetical protein